MHKINNSIIDVPKKKILFSGKSKGLWGADHESELRFCIRASISMIFHHDLVIANRYVILFVVFLIFTFLITFYLKIGLLVVIFNNQSY